MPVLSAWHRPFIFTSFSHTEILLRENKTSSLPAATKLGQGNVFTGVCDSVHRGGVCLRSRHPSPLGADTPHRADTPLGPGTPPGTKYTPRD